MATSTARHPNVEVWEQVYATFTSGDMDRLAQLIAPDVVWHVPGTNLISGIYTSREAIVGYFNKIYELADGSYKPRLLDIVADDDYTVAILHGIARRGDRSLDQMYALRQPHPRRPDRRAAGGMDRRRGLERILIRLTATQACDKN